MGKAPCCSKVGLHKGPWSTKEDTLLTNYIQAYGEGQWRSLPKKAGLLRCGKSCRLRWMNYLRPGIKRGNITSDEEDLIIRLHSLLGNRWSLIAGRLPGRTDNEIKNYWNTHLIKKLRNAGIEPKSNKNHVSKKPKESKKKKTMAAAGAAESNDSASRKKKLQKNSSINDSNSESSAAAKIKVYVPKPIRISPGFSSNNSIVDSPLTCSSSSHEEEEAKNEAMVGMSHFDDHEEAKAEVSDFGWPFIELGDSNYGGIHVGEVDDQVLIEDCNFSFQDSLPTISNMLEKVYDEYLQLL